MAAIRSLAVQPGSPYAAPLERFLHFLEENSQQGDGGALTPETVARVIVEAVEDEHPQTRYRIGEEVERLVELRKNLSDSEWDAVYRQLFG